MLLSKTAHTHSSALLTASKLVASIRAVLLPVADVVSRYTLSTLTRGLIRPAGSGWDGGTHWLLGCGDRGGGRGCGDWNNWPYWVGNKSSIKLVQTLEL